MNAAEVTSLLGYMLVFRDNNSTTCNAIADIYSKKSE